MPVLQLPGVRAIGEPEVKGRDIRYVAETTSGPTTCQCCMSLLAKTVRFGVRRRQIMDMPDRNKMRVGLLVRQKRFKCYECGKTFVEHLPFADEKRNMTKRLISYVEREAASKRTFVHIAEETGLLEKTVRDIFEDFCADTVSKMKFEVPEVLGLDEIHIMGVARAVITNTLENTIIEMLPDANKKTVADYLRTLNPLSVKCINTDMCGRYRDAINEVMPNVTVVSDKPHILFKAGKCLDSFRIEYMAKLKKDGQPIPKRVRTIMRQRNFKLSEKSVDTLARWLEEHPLLWHAYAAKEDFYAIYDAPDIKNAEARFDAWVDGLHETIRPHFAGFIDTINNWRKEVFSHFVYWTTNAAAESLNARIRDIDRAGKGLSFKVLRMKVLYTEGRHKIKTIKYQRDKFTISRMGGSDVWVRNFGTSISTLIEHLDKGQL